MATSLYEKAAEAAAFLRSRARGRTPEAAVVLGSGLDGVVQAISNQLEIDYGEIPNFVSSTVDGHTGRLVFGDIDGTEVVVMRGRVHFYEGYSMEEITLPVRTFSVMGIRTLVLTNAAGAISPLMVPGSLMLVTDHINLMGSSPLRGPNDERLGPRFPDMTEVYTAAYIDMAHEVASEMGITLDEGIYLALSGPAYETPAEVRMLRDLGADAVGMSTVPEAIAARHSGMKVLALSLMTNIAAGLANKQINHQEVMEIGARAGKQISELLCRLVPRLCAAP
ncbi:MAG TPA: purine-nucleoside phosphorylase [Blastocatellia bacterium]|nr:purine-nucleoside phosphorylase [Blastocatellia bacterium]